MAALPPAQSCGTWMRVHSYRMSGARRPTTSSATSGQDRQVGAVPGAAASPSTSVRGANAGSVQPAVTTTAAVRPATVSRKRRVRSGVRVTNEPP